MPLPFGLMAQGVVDADQIEAAGGFIDAGNTNGEDLSAGAKDAFDMALLANNIEALKIKSGASANSIYVDATGVGIGGTTAPQNKLDVKGAAVIGAAYSGTETAPSNGLLVEGNVGIGIIIPDNPLTVSGDANFIGDVGIGASSPSADLHVKGTSQHIRLEEDSSGLAALSLTMPGVELITAGMSLSSTFGVAIKFMSDDSAFTTESPKLLALIVPRALENYNADTKGGMALDFATTPTNPGATNVPVVNMTIDGGGNVGIGTTVPASLLHVKSADALALPVLTLEQLDVGEEMVEFITTIGVGNAIEGIAAKTYTTTHLIKVTIPGPLTRYMPCGTLV